MADIYLGRRKPGEFRLTGLQAGRRFRAEDAHLDENPRKIENSALVNNLGVLQGVDERADCPHLTPRGGQTEEIAGMCASDRRDEHDTVAVDHQIPFREAQVGERGEPDLINSLNLVPSFEDAAGRTDDDRVTCVVRSERGRIVCVPRRLATVEQRCDLLAIHSSYFGEQKGRAKGPGAL